MCAKAGSGPALLVTAPGYAPATRHGVDSRRPLEVRLTAAARLKGRVTSAADGTAVEGVAVRLVYGGMRVGRDTPVFAATSDPDGQYALNDLPAGDAVIVVEGGPWHARGAEDVGSGSFNPLQLTLDPGAVRTVDVVVEPGAVVTGVVRTDDGRPVAGALVRAEAEGRETLAPRGDAAYRVGAAATAPDGTWLIRGLAGVPYRFVASAPGYASVRSTTVEGDIRDQTWTSSSRRTDASRSRCRRRDGGPLRARWCASDRRRGSRGRGDGSTARTARARGAARPGPAAPAPTPSTSRWPSAGCTGEATVGARMRRARPAGSQRTGPLARGLGPRLGEAVTKERAAYGPHRALDGTFTLRGLPPGEYDARLARARPRRLAARGLDARRRGRGPRGSSRARRRPRAALVVRTTPTVAGPARDPAFRTDPHDAHQCATARSAWTRATAGPRSPRVQRRQCRGDAALLAPRAAGVGSTRARSSSAPRPPDLRAVRGPDGRGAGRDRVRDGRARRDLTPLPRRCRRDDGRRGSAWRGSAPTR